MSTALHRAPTQTRSVPSNTSSLTDWTLVRARANQDLAQLQSWLANEANAEELGVLLQRTPTLLYSCVDHAMHKRWLSSAQTEAVTIALAGERTSHVAMWLLLSATPETLWQDQARAVRHPDCALSASGAIAGFWACQVQVAASIEKAIVRLGLPSELLQFKRRHSARCARSLIEWGRASRTDLQAFPGTHRVASGITSMVDKYCALLASPTAA
jgi:hypothetical protein